MTKTLTALFDRYEDAEAAVRRLEQAGIPHDDISIVAHNGDGRHKALEGATAAPAASAAAADAQQGAGIGATVGGIGGLLTGLGLLAIPGLGPVAAAGWLGATIIGALGGAAVGGAAGGLVGALTEAGVPEEDANVYAEGVRRGGSLVSARVADSLEQTARDILDDNTRVDLTERRAAYRNEGWTRFDPEARAYGETI